METGPIGWKGQNELRATRTPMQFGDGVDLRFCDHTTGGFGYSVEMQHVEPGKDVPVLMHLSMHEALTLLDELWRCGLRPTELASPASDTLVAMKEHLEDFRAIAFHTLKIKPPMAK